MKGQEEATPPPLFPFLSHLCILYTFVLVEQAVPACGYGAVPEAVTPPRGGEARPQPAPSRLQLCGAGKGRRKGEESGREKAGRRRPPVRREEAGKPARARPLPRGQQVESAEVVAAAAAAASPGARGRWRAAPGARGPSTKAHGSLAVPGLRLRASSMAEGRRREDEEEELRERRELGGPRRARGRALSGHSAAGEGRGEREGARRRGGRAPRGRAGPARDCGGSLTRPGGAGSFNCKARRRESRVAFPSSSSLAGRA